MATAGRYREIHARIVEHPLRVVGFQHGRLGREEGSVESHARVEIRDGEVDMESLHGNGILELMGSLRKVYVSNIIEMCQRVKVGLSRVLVRG